MIGHIERLISANTDAVKNWFGDKIKDIDTWINNPANWQAVGKKFDEFTGYVQTIVGALGGWEQAGKDLLAIWAIGTVMPVIQVISLLTRAIIGIGTAGAAGPAGGMLGGAFSWMTRGIASVAAIGAIDWLSGKNPKEAGFQWMLGLGGSLSPEEFYKHIDRLNNLPEGTTARKAARDEAGALVGGVLGGTQAPPPKPAADDGFFGFHFGAWKRLFTGEGSPGASSDQLLNKAGAIDTSGVLKADGRDIGVGNPMPVKVMGGSGSGVTEVIMPGAAGGATGGWGSGGASGGWGGGAPAGIRARGTGGPGGWNAAAGDIPSDELERIKRANPNLTADQCVKLLQGAYGYGNVQGWRRGAAEKDAPERTGLATFGYHGESNRYALGGIGTPGIGRDHAVYRNQEIPGRLVRCDQPGHSCAAAPDPRTLDRPRRRGRCVVLVRA